MKGNHNFLSVVFALLLAAQMIIPSGALTLLPADTGAEEAAAEMTEATVVPGKNVFTGDTYAVTFETEDDLAFVSSLTGRYDKTKTFTSGIGARTAYNGIGNSLTFKKNESGTDASEHFVATLTFDMGMTVDRPALMIMRVCDAYTQWRAYGSLLRSNTAGDWRNGTLKLELTEDKTLSGDTLTVDAWLLDGNTYNMYLDNLAVIPYYKITYKNILPDGTTGEDIIAYELDTESVSVNTDDGVIAGLPTSLKPRERLYADGYTNIGWSTEEGATEAMTAIPLANEDLVLYPVWDEGEHFFTTQLNPGLNVYTATNKAITFDEANAMDRFTITPRWDKNATVDYGIASVGSYGKALWFRNTNGVTDASGHFVVNVAVKADVTIDRPAYVIFRVRDACTLWGGLPGGGWARSNTSGNWDNGVIKATYTEDAPLNSDTINVQPWAVYSNKYEMFIDNFALIPYYKITFKTVYPDGTTGEDTVSYELDTANISVDTSDGVIAGLPSAFIPTQTLEADGARFLGWALEEDSEMPVSEVALANTDIVLWPVWSNKVVGAHTATIWLDTEKTQKKVVPATEGDTVKFPGYEELKPYTPAGLMALGFAIGNKVYAPGDTYTFTVIDELTENLEIEAVYGKAPLSEYGELIYLETFESVSVPKTLYSSAESVNVRHPVSYVSDDWQNMKSCFTVGKADSSDTVEIVDDGTGNNAVKVTKVNGSWPQFSVRLNSGDLYRITKPGIYTATADVMVPSEYVGKVNKINVTTYYNGGASYLQSSYSANASSAGKYTTIKVSMPVYEGNVYDVLNQVSYYANLASGAEAGSCFYVDNIALYRMKGRFDVTGLGEDADKSFTSFYNPGESVSAPEKADVVQYTKAGCVLTGFDRDGTFVNFGETIETAQNETAVTLSAVYEPVNYAFRFLLGKNNGTVADLFGKTGERIILPTANLVTGWRIPAMDTVFAAGSTLAVDDVFEYAMGGEIRFEAVSAEEITPTGFTAVQTLEDGLFIGANNEQRAKIAVAYGTGILPADEAFEGTKTLTVGEALILAARMHDAYYGETHDYTDLAGLETAMISCGVAESDLDLNADATVLDAGKLFANAIADERYAKLAETVPAGLTADDDGYYEMRKLVQAGILAVDTDSTKAFTMNDALDLIEKIVQESTRSASGLTVYILGDSLCAGTGGESHTGWIRKSENWFDADVAFVNYAVGGISTQSYYVSKRENADYTNLLNTIKPGDYVLIALGTNDSTLWSVYGSPQYPEAITFEESLAYYKRFAAEIAAAGGIPVYVCPVGRNKTDETGNYVESDPDIITCMTQASEESGIHVPIVDFKSITLARFGAMTAGERAAIYHDSVHTTDYGANLVCGIFGELLTVADDARLDALRAHLLSEKQNVEVTVNYPAVSLANAAKAGDRVTVTAATEHAAGALLVIGVYDANGRLLAVRTAQAADETPIIFEQAANAERIKAYLLADAESLRPIAEEASVIIP